MIWHDGVRCADGSLIRTNHDIWYDGPGVLCTVGSLIRTNHDKA